MARHHCGPYQMNRAFHIDACHDDACPRNDQGPWDRQSGGKCPPVVLRRPAPRLGCWREGRGGWVGCMARACLRARPIASRQRQAQGSQAHRDVVASTPNGAGCAETANAGRTAYHRHLAGELCCLAMTAAAGRPAAALVAAAQAGAAVLVVQLAVLAQQQLLLLRLRQQVMMTQLGPQAMGC